MSFVIQVFLWLCATVSLSYILCTIYCRENNKRLKEIISLLLQENNKLQKENEKLKNEKGV